MSILLPLLLVAAPVQSGPPLPPDVDPGGWLSGFLGRFREPLLWREGVAKGYRTRTRMSLMAHVDVMVSLRIDERDDGRLVGTAVLVRRSMKSGDVGREVAHFRVTRKEMAELDAQAAAHDLFKFRDGSFASADDACIDGLVMVFERVNADGYRSSQANAQCDAPRSLRQYALNWLRVAHVEYFRSWLDK